MIQFLYMSENERKKRYGYDVNTYYKRIVESVDRSFQDAMIAFSHLPENVHYEFVHGVEVWLQSGPN